MTMYSNYEKVLMTKTYLFHVSSACHVRFDFIVFIVGDMQTIQKYNFDIDIWTLLSLQVDFFSFYPKLEND